MPVIGDTVILRATFYAFNGILTSPTVVTLRLYDVARKQVGEDIPVNSTYLVSTGVYEYPYTIPDGYGNLTFEFTGILDGFPAVARGTIEREWI
jgi:hypothetical protein